MALPPRQDVPVGYGFRPTDEELIDYFLRNKIKGNEKKVEIIREIDICNWEPWDLPGLSVVESIDNQWFFFSRKDWKYQHGQRMNRTTKRGYWKVSGLERTITSRNRAKIGTKRTLLFYIGRIPKGKKSIWTIHEYHATDESIVGTRPGKGEFVICRLFKRTDLDLEEIVEHSKCNEKDKHDNVLLSDKIEDVPELEEIVESSKCSEKDKDDNPVLLNDKKEDNPEQEEIAESSKCNEKYKHDYFVLPIDEMEDNILNTSYLQDDLDLEKLLGDLSNPPNHMQETTECQMFSSLIQTQLENPFSNNTFSFDHDFNDKHNIPSHVDIDAREDNLLNTTSLTANLDLEKLLKDLSDPIHMQGATEWQMFSALIPQMPSQFENSLLYNCLTADNDVNNNQQSIPSVLTDPEVQSHGDICAISSIDDPMFTNMLQDPHFQSEVTNKIAIPEQIANNSDVNTLQDKIV